MPLKRLAVFTALFVTVLWSCRTPQSGMDGDTSLKAINEPGDGVTELDLGYDPGPDANDPVGAGYIDLINKVPNYVYVGYGLGGFRTHKFRYPYGVMPWRGPTRKNSVKVLVIGQDGTHIAEGAGRPFTGGTGGRVQNALAYLGIRDSALFMNTFAFTIQGQYADYAPVLWKDQDGNQQVRWMQFLSPEGFMLAQHPESPIVQWRNEFIDHVIDSNRDSLKMIFLIGGAARDTMATYLRSRGVNVNPAFSEEFIKDRIQTVVYGKASAGGNRAFFYPKDRRGRDVLQDGRRRNDYKDEAVQTAARERAQGLIDKMVPLKAGKGALEGTGVMDAGQFGYYLKDGFNIRGTMVRGQRVENNITLLDFRHPGSLSPQLEADFQATFDVLNELPEDDRYPPADEGMQNKHKDGIRFDYSDKPPIPTKDFPFGKTSALIVNSSLASRSGKNVIVFGGREGRFGRNDVRAQESATPVEGVNSFRGKQPWNPVYTKTASSSEGADYDRGPGKEWADLFRTFPEDELFNAGVVTSDKKFGTFGYFRGYMNNPKVIVFADPSDKDHDDMYTARALSGGLGQKVQGFMNGLGVGEEYLVIKTLPVDMSNASDSDWDKAMDITKTWREQVVAKAMALNPTAVIALGKHVSEAMSSQREVVKIYSDSRENFDRAYNAIRSRFNRSRFNYKEESIPRAHLPYPIQAWIGTSGERGVAASGRNAGQYYGIVAPGWVGQFGNDRTGRGFDAEKAYLDRAKGLVREHGFAYLGNSMGATPRRGGWNARDTAEADGEMAATDREFDNEDIPVDGVDQYFDYLNSIESTPAQPE